MDADNIHILKSLQSEHIGHKCRSLSIDKTMGIKAVYCQSCSKITEYVFRKSKGWQPDQSEKFSTTHAAQFKSFKHIAVDQESEFLKVVGTMLDDITEDFLPTSASFILNSESKEEKLAEEIVDKGMYHRARVIDPAKFEADTLRTIDLGNDSGIRAITGRLQGADSTTIQAYLFDTSRFTPGEAKDWLNAHDVKPIEFVEGEKEKSISEIEEVGIVKVDKEARLVYGVFLYPEKADHDGDVISAPDIEKVAHGFMTDYRAIDEMHAKDAMDAEIVQSFIAWKDGIDFFGKILNKGTWAGAIHISDDAVWEKVKDGTYKGFSVRISGIREPIGKGA